MRQAAPSSADTDPGQGGDPAWRRLKPAFWMLSLCLLLGVNTHFFVSPTWVEQKTTIPVSSDASGQLSYRQGQQVIAIDRVVPYADSPL